MANDGNADNIREDDDTYACDATTGGGKRSTTATLCDAEDVEIETSVTFPSGWVWAARQWKTYTLTCEWDAVATWDGNVSGYSTDRT